VRTLAQRFVPCADEVFRLHKRSGVECDFFRGFCDQGHYGKNGADATRQGIYAVTPSGRFLASVNTTDPKRMAAMLELALRAWEGLGEGERYLDPAPAGDKFRAQRGEANYPKDGLVLRSFVRDLPKQGQRVADDGVADDWRGKAWNTDLVWYGRAEARRFLPDEPKRGDTHTVPSNEFERLVRFTFVDSVRGQTLPFAPGHVKEAKLVAEVVAVKGSRVELKFRGSVHTEATGDWSVGGQRDAERSPQKRGFRGEVGGVAVYDLQAERFVAFRLVASGTRWGGTRFNFRQDDLDPAPIGFVVQLASDKPADTVAPAFWYAYGR
jgi:hypothetical protein